MDSRPMLDLTGFLVSLAMAGAVIAFSRRQAGRRPFLSLLFLEATLFFLGDFLAARGLAPALSLALSLGSNFYGLPSLYFHAEEALGYRPTKTAWHYIPGAVAAVAGTALALDTGAHGFHGGLPLALYMIGVPFVQVIQLVAYGRAGLRLSPARPQEGKPDWPRRAILAALVGYGAFVALSMVQVGILMATELLDRPVGSLPGIDVSSSLVAVFLIWTLGLCALWGADRASAAGGKYGGKELPSGDRALVLKKLGEVLESTEDLASEEVTPRRLAERIGEPYYLMSRVVNESGAGSVADLVNEHRIRRAKRLIAARPDATMLEIALDSGFQAKSTFNEVFRKNTGVTPSQYRKGLSAKDETRES